MQWKAILALILINGSVFAQLIINGSVTSLKSGESLAYVNIGIKNKNCGTVSGINGDFNIKVPLDLVNDSLTFFLTGYEIKTIAIKEIKSPVEVKLTELPVSLNEIVVTGKKYKEEKFGIKKNGFLFHFIDASINQNDVFEIAQRIKLPRKKSKLVELNFYVNESTTDSVKLRINFYSMDKGSPGERVPTKEMLFNCKLNEGWNTFDLTGFNIFLFKEVVAAIEFLPQKGRKPIQYEVKIGANVKSFVRSSSLGTWGSPPHYYCMNVTVLKDPDDKERIDNEKKLDPPKFRLFSDAVQDSFYIYVSVPNDYNKDNRRYRVDYLLDGNAYFAKCGELSKQGKDQGIIVAIGYSNVYFMDSLRDRDYTFPVALKDDSLKISGGAEKFYRFITGELIPLIDKIYRTDTTNRQIAGHSLGGYFVLYTLVKENELGQNHFKYYTSASPSIEYANNYMFSQIPKLKESAVNYNLYITTGDKENIDIFSRFVEILKASKVIRSETEIFRGLDHMEAALPAFGKALKNSRAN